MKSLLNEMGCAAILVVDL